MSFNHLNINNNQIRWGIPVSFPTIKSSKTNSVAFFSPQTLNVSSNNINRSENEKDCDIKENPNKYDSNYSLFPLQIDLQRTNYENNNNLDYLSDDYSGLSYLFMPNCETAGKINNNLKKCSDYDYRTKYKTEKCKYWEINKFCKFADNCAFAHGNQDIRNKESKLSNYKTKKCKHFFELGYCSYGSRCQFLHKDSNDANNNKSNKFSYKRSIDELNSINDKKDLPLTNTNKLEKKEISIKLRPRLETFEKIVRVESVDKKKSKLVEEVLHLKNCYLKIHNFFDNEYSSSNGINKFLM